MKQPVLTKAERKLLLELISNEQIHMLRKNKLFYNSEKYKQLEELKVKIS